jgi:hypothetical protein
MTIRGELLTFKAIDKMTVCSRLVLQVTDKSKESEMSIFWLGH